MSTDTPTLHLVDRLFGPIEDAPDARALTRLTGIGLVLLAPLQAVLALAGGRGALVDAALLAVTGTLLWGTASRWAAGAALAVGLGSAALALGGLAGDAGTAEGRSILLAMAAIWLAGRGLVAAVALRRFSRGAGPGRSAQGSLPRASTST